jgi:hypothetical protein
MIKDKIDVCILHASPSGSHGVPHRHDDDSLFFLLYTPAITRDDRSRFTRLVGGVGGDSVRHPPALADMTHSGGGGLSPSLRRDDTGGRANEVAISLMHFERGLGLPVSNFLYGFLDFFGLQSHHLPANALLSLSSYVSL